MGLWAVPRPLNLPSPKIPAPWNAEIWRKIWNMYTFACVLAEMVTKERESPRAAASSFLPKKTHSKTAEQAGKSPLLPPMAKATRGSWRELLAIWGKWRNTRAISHWPRESPSTPTGRIAALWACLAIAVSETGYSCSPLGQGLCRGGMPVLPAPSWSCDGQEQWRQPCSSTPHNLADAVSDQAGKNQDRQPKREGCCHPCLSDVFFKAGWKYMPRASIRQTQVCSSMFILTRFNTQKKPFLKKSRGCDAVSESEPQPLIVRIIL